MSQDLAISDIAAILELIVEMSDFFKSQCRFCVIQFIETRVQKSLCRDRRMSDDNLKIPKQAVNLLSVLSKIVI
ncbi:hypothetical protein WI72_24705 [Burkholderia ubonensis]|nr:hypothetical protein WI72_24705 [Burkholderia ubonensis]KVD96690.1 hypothetical protein WI90_02400 [Burkholderia ubonensis]